MKKLKENKKVRRRFLCPVLRPFCYFWHFYYALNWPSDFFSQYIVIQLKRKLFRWGIRNQFFLFQRLRDFFAECSGPLYFLSNITTLFKFMILRRNFKLNDLTSRVILVNNASVLKIICYLWRKSTINNLLFHFSAWYWIQRKLVYFLNTRKSVLDASSKTFILKGHFKF